MLNIAWKFIKQQTRSIEFFIIQMLLPLIIIVLLGFILNSAFESNDIKISGSIAYFGDSRDLSMLTGLEMDLKLRKVDSVQEGRRILAEGEVQAFLDVSTADNIVLYHPENGSFASSISELVLRTEGNYQALYTTLAQQASINGELVQPISTTQAVEIPIVGLQADIKPRSIDYYGVTMLFMFMLFSSYAAAYGIIMERSEGTLNRILVSPRSAGSFFGGLSLGALVGTLIPALVVLGVGSIVLKIQYGSNWFLWAGLLFSTSLLSMGLGFFFGTFIKKNQITDAMINVIIQIWTFLGGGFVLFPEGDIFRSLGKISPLYWIYNAAFESIYSDSFSFVLPGLLIPAAIGGMLIILSGVRFTKGALQ